MKRIIMSLLMMAIMSGIACHAQKKLFEEALKHGRTSNGTYIIDNSKNEAVSMEKVKRYAEGRYTIINSSEKYFTRFGQTNLIVDKVEFIDKTPQQNLKDYFNQKFAPSFDFTKVYEVGSCIVYTGGSDNPFRAGGKPVLVDGIKWNGKITNGYLDGKGVGIIDKGNGMIYKIEGSFDIGFPASEILVYYTDKNNFKYKGHKIEDGVIRHTHYDQIGFKDIGRLCYYYGNRAEIKNAVDTYAQGHYNEHKTRIDRIYNDLKTINVSNSESVLDPFIEKYISFCSDSKYDPSNILPKAKVIKEMFDIIKALTFDYTKVQYYTIGKYLGYGWKNSKENDVRNQISDAIGLVRKGKERSSDFTMFLSQAENKLNDKASKYEIFIQNKKNEYNQEMDAFNAERRDFSGGIAEIIEPSGELIQPMFTRTCAPKKSGTIRFKNGEYIIYTIIYDGNSKKFECYYIQSAPTLILNRLKSNSFKSQSEMMNAIYEAIK